MQTSFRITYPHDDPGSPDQDLAFIGIDMLSSPQNVAPGFVCASINKRLTQDGIAGAAGTRRGLFTPGWGRAWSSQFPARNGFTLGITDTCWGVGTFTDPGLDKQRWIVGAGATGLYFFRETEVARFIPYPNGETVSGLAQVVQQFNNLFIFRSSGEDTLIWVGNWAGPIGPNVVTNPLGNPYAPMPSGYRGLAWRNRNWIIAGPDDAIASRIADYTQYQQVNSGTVLSTDYFVNQGTGDKLKTLTPMGNFSLLMFKGSSLHIFSAQSGDLSDSTVDELTREISFDAPNTAIAVNGQVWWLDTRGVRSAVLTALNQIQINPQPISARIQPLIRRINWAYVSLSSAIIFDNHAYFAVPLDQETKPAHILVYDLLTQEWQSLDQWNSTLGFDIVGFAVAPWLGTDRLFAISSTMQVACLDYGLGEDFIYPNTSPIVDKLVTRGYTSGERSKKRWLRTEVQLETWNPTVALSAQFEGVNKILPLAAPTRDRTQFFSAQDVFNVLNVDGRSENPDRQDYSVVIPSGSNGLQVDTVTTGVSLESFQFMAERRALDEREAAYVQISIGNSTGACRIRAVGVESQAGTRDNSQSLP